MNQEVKSVLNQENIQVWGDELKLQAEVLNDLKIPPQVTYAIWTFHLHIININKIMNRY